MDPFLVSVLLQIQCSEHKVSIISNMFYAIAYMPVKYGAKYVPSRSFNPTL